MFSPVHSVLLSYLLEYGYMLVFVFLFLVVLAFLVNFDLFLVFCTVRISITQASQVF